MRVRKKKTYEEKRLEEDAKKQQSEKGRVDLTKLWKNDGSSPHH